MIDRARQVGTKIGLRSRRVFLVWTQWSGPEIGTGDEVELARMELLPTPRVVGIDAVAFQSMSAGVLPEGSIKVDCVSVRYTEDQLRGHILPPSPGCVTPLEWNPPPPNGSFFYEVVEDGRGDAEPVRQKYRLSSQAWRREGASLGASRSSGSARMRRALARVVSRQAEPMGKVWSLNDAGLMLGELHKDMKAAAHRGLLAAAYRIVEHIVSDIIPGLDNPPVDRGIYRAGWRARRIGEGAIVENVSPHAAFIEYGVRGSHVKIGRAMIDALTAWVRRKGIGGRTVVSKSGHSRLVKASQTEARAIAWAIAKDMQRFGIFRPKGLRVLEKASKRFPEFIRIRGHP